MLFQTERNKIKKRMWLRMTGGKLVSSGYNLEEITYLPAHLEVTYLYVEQNGNLTSFAAFELGTVLFAKQNI